MSIRSRIFIVFVLALLVGFGTLTRWLSGDVAHYYNESFEEVLVDTAHILAEVVALDLQAGHSQLKNLQTAFRSSQLRRFSSQIYAIKKSVIDLHVYVTDKKGIVIFDSNQGKAVGQDYSKWRDVKLTLAGQYGARTSKMLEEAGHANAEPVSIAYVGAPIYSDGIIIGMVSVGKPKTNIEKFVVNAKKNLIFAVLASIVLAIVLALMLYEWVTKPLNTLVTYAGKISRGEKISMPILSAYETREVAEAIESMRLALENKQYVEKYIQTLTHEIKSPLTAITTSAELLASPLTEDKRQQFSRTIRCEADRLNEFANRLLQLASVERLNALEKLETVHWQLIIQAVVESLQSESLHKGVTITTRCDDDDKVQGDEFLLRQAIENLLRNALDFSPSGSVVTLCGYVDHDAWVVDVLDQGSGIPDYAMSRIFERFYSLPRASGKKSTGLGLNFVREVALLHGGSITLDNLSPGIRARFFCKRSPARNLHTIST